MTTDTTWRAYAALVLTVAGIAWSAILVRWAGVPGAASGFYRVLIAAAVLVPWRLARGATRRSEPHAALLAIAGGAFFALDLAFWNTAVMRTQAAIASLLGNNTPIFVGLASWWMFRRRPSRAFWAGLLCSIAGCMAIVARDLDAAAAGGQSLSGAVLAVTASVFFAAYLITTERIRERMDTLTFNTLAIAGSVLTLLVVCVAFDVPLTGYSPRTWAALLALGLVSQLAAYFALVYALGHLPATITSIGLLAQVPCTALLAMVFLGEPLTRSQAAGGVLVLAGIYLANRGPQAEPRADG